MKGAVFQKERPQGLKSNHEEINGTWSGGMDAIEKSSCLSRSGGTEATEKMSCLSRSREVEAI